MGQGSDTEKEKAISTKASQQKLYKLREQIGYNKDWAFAYRDRRLYQIDTIRYHIPRYAQGYTRDAVACAPQP